MEEMTRGRQRKKVMGGGTRKEMRQDREGEEKRNDIREER